MGKAYENDGTHDCPEGGVGCKYENLPTMDSFVSMTGGSITQRRFQREYGKKAHESDAQAFPNTTEESLRRIILAP